MIDDGIDNPKRSYHARTTLDWATHAEINDLVTQTGRPANEVLYQVIMDGIASRAHDSDSPEMQLVAKVREVYKRRAIERHLVEVAEEYANKPDEFENLCRSNGFEVGNILANVEKRTSAISRDELKQRERCRCFMSGLLCRRENGLPIDDILRDGLAKSFSETQIRRSLKDIGAEQSYDGRVSFWFLPGETSIAASPVSPLETEAT